ncbi:MAG: rhomboid family intramembrane serine protease [Candidatus Lustribacter sp.]
MLTRILVAINVIVYLFERFVWGLDPNALYAHGGQYGAVLSDGEWWRIFASAFLHGSDLHIIFNMIALFQVGTFVELIFGAPRMAIIYFCAAFGGGAAVSIFTPDVVTIGASGAIFGLFGALAVAGLRLGPRGKSIMQQTTGIIVINLAISLLPGSNISIADHIGGLIVGTLCGLALFRMPRPRVPVAQPVGGGYAQRIGPDPGAVTIEHAPSEPSQQP